MIQNKSSNKKRRDRLARVRHRYQLSSLYVDQHAQTCAYCGSYADTQDHVLPVVFMEFLLSQNDTETYSEIVPSCIECNSLAGTTVFSSFKKKKAFVQAKIYNRYSRITEWTEEEIEFAELRGNLKQIVVADMKKRKHHVKRWSYNNPDYVGEYHKPIEEGHLKDVVRESVEYDKKAFELIERAKRKIKNESDYIFTTKKAAEFCDITNNELRKHMKSGNIDYIKDHLNRCAFKKSDLYDFIEDLEILRQEMSFR